MLIVDKSTITSNVFLQLNFKKNKKKGGGAGRS